MRNIMTGNTTASTVVIAVEELLSEGGWARGTATRSSPASTSPSLTIRRKTAVSTATMRWILPAIFKVTRRINVERSGRTVVREMRGVNVTWQRQEILIRTNPPSG